MSLRFLSFPAIVAFGLAIVAPPAASHQEAVSTAAPHQEPGQTTLDDQVDLAVTVYNSDIALVRDVRSIDIARGTAELHFMDIAATVNPATVHFRSLSEPARVGVVEQNYEYDLLEPDKLLRKYVGRTVTLVRRQSDGREVEIPAQLISYNNAPVWKINGEIVTGLGADHIRFPELPGNLYSRPTLIWTLDNTGAARHRVEASYLAGQLAWNADYVLTVARDDKAGDLDGWVTVRNGSGTSFKNASLQFVAGDLNRVRQELSKTADAIGPRAMAERTMQQEAFSDYHLYTLGRKTTVNNNETKQVSMLNATAFPVQKRYVVEGQQFYYRNAQHPGSPLKDVVQVYYQLKNETKSGLGQPMPAGTVRVYQADSRGGLQFVGEDRIDHTPKDETINLKIGNAFDVVCERKQTDFQRVGSNVYEFEYEVTLRNHKTTAVSVEVNEPIGGSWRMLQASHQWTKTDAWAAQFKVPVAADGTTVVKYRVRVTY
jgi:hypothetical protein